ncbi:hypothetical protein GE09DRAFT_339657 [Coniochaeta sp. 2T2.1]|nr:hypothetical protein GE09DRAFT_339657 [Coniochaeta sp. 2T2.1]
MRRPHVWVRHSRSVQACQLVKAVSGQRRPRFSLYPLGTMVLPRRKTRGYYNGRSHWKFKEGWKAHDRHRMRNLARTWKLAHCCQVHTTSFSFCWGTLTFGNRCSFSESSMELRSLIDPGEKATMIDNPADCSSGSTKSIHTRDIPPSVALARVNWRDRHRLRAAFAVMMIKLNRQRGSRVSLAHDRVSGAALRR